MDEQTRVKQILVRDRVRQIEGQEPASSAKLIELPAKPKGLLAFFSAENLGKNLAVVGCLALITLALQGAGQQENVSVFSALQSSLTASWDEDVGKLSFVSELLPQELRAVWNETPAVEVFQPMNGETVHAWSREEPYLEINGTVHDVRACANGEVMSVAHGMGEERIMRLRHSDGCESLYGNLAECFVQAGDQVTAGEIIGVRMKEKPLAFELRVDGRSIDPQSHLQPYGE